MSESDNNENGLAPLKVEFFTVYPDAPPPEPASSTVRGSLPARAVQFCPPVTAGSGFGWYVFPPVDFALRWDGQTTEWSLLEGNEPTHWQSLAGGYEGDLAAGREVLANLPESMRSDIDVFDRTREMIPFLDADPRAGDLVEVFPGVAARTSPGWALLLRSVPNWLPRAGFEALDGVIETAWHRSPLNAIIRLTTPGRVVRFHRRIPMLVLQPVPIVAVEAAQKVTASVTRGLAQWPADVWREVVEVRRRRQANPPGKYQPVGSYRMGQRQARREPEPADGTS